jgi:chemotaxis methyl-accepting protein methylase
MGDQVGTRVTPIAVPAAVRDTIKNRAVRIRPEVVMRITPIDMNVVFQTLPLAADQRFDLVVGTNIFLYYDALEQSLARVNLWGMIKPGGFLISNTALAAAASSKLADSLQTSLLVTDVPLLFDSMFR